MIPVRDVEKYYNALDEARCLVVRALGTLEHYNSGRRTSDEQALFEHLIETVGYLTSALNVQVVAADRVNQLELFTA